MDPRKNPSSLSNCSPQAGHARLSWNQAPFLKRVAPPQLGQRLRSPRETTWRRLTVMDEPGPPSGSQLEADEPADLDVLADLRDGLGHNLLNRLLGQLHEGLVHEADRREVLLELAVDDLLGGRGGLAYDLRGRDAALLC